jgi:phage gp46-like protein
MDRFQGDPRLILTANGATLRFKGGQPVMDRGWENYVLIALFTRRGWCGNVLFDNPSQKIGSDFEEAHEQAITLAALNDIREAAKRALADMESDGLASRVEVETTNPSGAIIETRITVVSPSNEAGQLLITKNGLNWLAQAVDPAYLRVA